MRGLLDTFAVAVDWNILRDSIANTMGQMLSSAIGLGMALVLLSRGAYWIFRMLRPLPPKFRQYKTRRAAERAAERWHRATGQARLWSDFHKG